MPPRSTPRQYAVYMTASWRRTLYTGVTGELETRAAKHKLKTYSGFTAKYNVDRLVWYELTSDVHAAIAREKQIKGWTRAKKLTLIKPFNPDWLDLASHLNDVKDSSPGALRRTQASE